MISDKGIKRLSVIITIVLHIFILFVPLPKSIMNIKPVDNAPEIPIKFVEKIVIIKKKKPPKPQPKPKKQKKIVQKKTQKKITSLPGDRKKASISQQSEPYYPKEAINNGWNGTIVVDVTIDGNGNVQKIQIYRSSGYDVLDRAFIDTIESDYTFKPKRVMGKNQVDTIRIKYNYAI